MEKELHILIVEDLPTDAELCEREVRQALPYSVFQRVETREEFLSALETFQPDLILSDYSMPRFDGMTALKLALERVPETPFIILTGSMNEETAVECMKTGAWDYVIKEHIKRLGQAVIAAMGQKRARTERKRMEETLKTSEAKYRSIFENAVEGIFQTTPEGQLLSINPSFARLTGYASPEELIESIKDLGHQLYVNPEDRTKFIRLIGERGIVEGYEVQQYCKDGSTIWVSINARCVYDEHGVLICYEGTFEDITSRKQAEEHLKETLEKLRKSLAGTIHALSSTVETRDPYTAGHQKKVSNLARVIAQEMGLSNDTVDTIRIAGVIHDIGKISIPAEILVKPGKISDVEFNLIKAHSQTGYDILKDVGLPYPIAEVAYQHHERLDGSGYPQGLKGDQILLEARIISVADVVEAITSFRPYRPGFGIDVALEEIEKNKGILYDAGVVEVCVKLFREKNFKFE